ncbi:MAG: hypothetical protein VB108_03860, partial [Anaerolineaceae bacterium]|nr:hypothetical protein [Anaerolineaceae bacterium]
MRKIMRPRRGYFPRGAEQKVIKRIRPYNVIRWKGGRSEKEIFLSFIFVVGITVMGVFLSLRNSSANASKAAQVQMGGSVVFERSEIDSMSQFAQAGSGKAIELDPLLKKLEQLQMTALSRLGPSWLHLDEETWFQARESESSHIAQDGTDETALSPAYSNS